jgi:hypothetical protein
MLLSGTVMDIPFLMEVSGNDIYDSLHPYTVLFDNGTTTSIPLSKMLALIPKPPVDIDGSNSQDSLLPPFLHLNSRSSYIHGKCEGVYRFMLKSHINKRKEDSGIYIPNLPITWADICVECISGYRACFPQLTLLPHMLAVLNV